MSGTSDLVSTRDATRAGFVALALERNIRATPFIDQARALHATAIQCQSASDLARLTDIRDSLLAAAGVSDKAAGHMSETDKDEAISGLITKFLEPAGDKFGEELVYRFLLTRGDSLGGSMRNIAGALGQLRLSRAVMSALSIRKLEYQVLVGAEQRWITPDPLSGEIERGVKGISWRAAEHRTLIYNLNVPIVHTNVDACLFRCRAADWMNNLNQPTKYAALGELKGGVDPAGADERWKTARTAISRIRREFASHECNPATFFISGAIAKKMSTEIWSFLQQGTLSNAANLLDPDQLASICRWLVGL